MRFFVENFLLFFFLFLVAFAFVIFYAWKVQFKKETIKRSLKLKFLLVSLPKEQKPKDEEKQNYQEILAVAEPFISSLQAIFQQGVFYKLFSQPLVSLEITAHSGKIFFYVGVPKDFKDMVVRQIQAQYPAAFIEETNDYSVFRNPENKVAGGVLKLKRKFVFPIKTYREIELDPLNAVTNVLSKLPASTTASIQYLIQPRNENWRFASLKTSRLILEGKNPHASKLSHFLETAGKILRSRNKEEEMLEKEKNARLSAIHEAMLKKLEEKASKLAFNVEVKILVSAPTLQEARSYLSNIFSAFAIFDSPEANGFLLKNVNSKKLIAGYLFRNFISKPLILNTEEIATIWHFPNRNVDTPNIHFLRSRILPPPPNLPEEGTVIGKTVFRGEEKLVRIKPKDRLRHVYEIGKTGVGKTVLLQNMVLQDIKNGDGVCFIDPNGDAIEYILNHIPPERGNDVILFEPFDLERPMGLNLLEWHRPEDKDFLIQEAISIFYKLFDPGRIGIIGPQFEHWFRNAALTVMSNPKGGSLIDIPRLFVDKDYEEELVSYVKDPMVLSFWKQQMAQTADFHKSEMLNYFISKFGRFMTNTMMRNIIGQTHSAFNLREAMDNRKIILINLAKGLTGDINANLLGMIFTVKIQMAAFSRQDQPEEKRVPFYFYVDEFQNFTTDSFATILSEARKYRLALTIANQYISQLPELIRDAVIGNAGTLIVWRIGALDAEFMVKEFEPLTIEDIVNLDQFNFYTKLLIDNAPSKPFNCRSLPPAPPNPPEVAAAIRELSRSKYGRPVDVVDYEIRERTRVDEIFKEVQPTSEYSKEPSV